MENTSHKQDRGSLEHLSSYKVFLCKIIMQGPDTAKICVNATQFFRVLYFSQKCPLMNNT